jgi:inner membrane protein
VPAVAALFFLCGYVSFQWVQQQQAVAVGEYYAREQGFDDVTVSALPRPVSPFNWMVIVAQRDFYHYAFVNLRRNRALAPGPDAGFIARLDSAYLPAASARWERMLRLGVGEERALAEQVWVHADFGFFRWFSAYPVLAQVDRDSPSVCVWFQDLRFLIPGRDTWPFRYGMCRSAGEPWLAYEAGDDGERIKLQP